MPNSFWALFFGLSPNSSIDENVGRMVFDESKDPRYQGFSDFYDKRIKPQIFELELARTKCLRKFIVRARISVMFLALFFSFVAVLVLGGAITTGKDYFEASKIFGMILIGILLWLENASSFYRQEIKNKIFSEIFKFFSDVVYREEGSVSLEGCEKFLIVPTYDKCETQDMILGQYQGTDFCFQELKLLERCGTKICTKFEGVQFIFQFNKKFSGETIVRKNDGKIGNMMRGGHYDLEKVKLEDPEFAEKFEVHSTDQIEARYLLSVDFMEKLKSLGEFFESDEVEADFSENKLLIMIGKTEDLFEAESSVLKEVNLIKECEMVIQQMYLIFGVVEVLQINRNRSSIF